MQTVILEVKRATPPEAVEFVGMLHTLECTACNDNLREALRTGRDVWVSQKATSDDGRIDDTRHIIGVAYDK